MREDLFLVIMRNFLKNDQRSWLSIQTIPSQMYSRNAGKFDDTMVYLSDDLWRVKYGGRVFTFRFERGSDYSLIMKWYLSKCWPSYSIHALHASCNSVKKFIDRNDDQCVNFNSVYKYLRFISKNGENFFYEFKLFARVLVDYEFPGFSHDDGFKLSEIFSNRKTNVDNYYDIDLKISPEITSFIRRGIVYSINYLNELNHSEVRDLAIFCTCYETGARPIQLQRMSKDCFYEFHENHYQISIPVSKQGYKKKDNKSIRISTSSELGIILKKLISNSSTRSKQLFARDDGEFYSDDVVRSINNAMKKFDRTGLSIDQFPKIYPYDLRHNVAHTLAMSGASAEEIAYILGHSSLTTARHYISATPEISFLIEKAIGGNQAYISMMGVILTGEIDYFDKSVAHYPAAQINSELHFGIGVCSSNLCHFRPVSDCYGCSDFHPDSRANHEHVRDSLQKEIAQIVEISDQTGQLKRNPIIFEHESRIREVTHVIDRCKRIREF